MIRFSAATASFYCVQASGNLPQIRAEWRRSWKKEAKRDRPPPPPPDQPSEPNSRVQLITALGAFSESGWLISVANRWNWNPLFRQPPFLLSS